MSENKLSAEKLESLKDQEGFPKGRFEDIITLSQPPNYTACPNPWLQDFIDENGRPYDPNEQYHRQPFASDVSEGKNDPIYNAHTYHTKVPHKAIMRYILHYTNPGDIVYDGFCGTGMTGVAAQMCGSPEPDFKKIIEQEMPYVEWGSRKAVLCDLSPAATFIAHNYNQPGDPAEFEKEAKRIIAEVEKECGWMYETDHVVDGQVQLKQRFDGGNEAVRGRINYTVWSDVFICPTCSEELVYWDIAINKEDGKIKEDIHCNGCASILSKRSLERSWEHVYDRDLSQTIKRAKQVPVLINYSVGRKRFEKTPDQNDLDLIKKIDGMDIPYWYPTNRMPDGYNTEQPRKSHGATHVHHFYSMRSLILLANIHKIILNYGELDTYQKLLWVFTGIQLYSTKMNRYTPSGKLSKFRNLSGTLYIASLYGEINVIDLFKNKALLRIKKIINNDIENNALITTASSESIPLLDNTIDYIFTDPPFGSNLMYSELSFIWEAWLKVFTNNKSEAIVNKVQGKSLPEYQELMEKCFSENYRILKPGRWMTVEFHNSKNSVWMSIQEALMRAGFMVADVRTLDKVHGTFKQVTTTSSVKQDLIISAYKPNEGLEERMKLIAGTEEGAWEFLQQHLRQLPIPSHRDGLMENIVERQKYLLYDRMIAFHVQRGITVPISSGDFYKGLHQRYPERDGMYFLPEQVEIYEREKILTNGMEQMTLFIFDEKSAIAWLRQFLKDGPLPYSEIYNDYLRNLHRKKHEVLPELSEILEQNYLKDDEGRWYVPDPFKESDLRKIRDRELYKQFQSYLGKRGKLKTFRTEAIRVGFERCWADKDYKSIIEIGERLPVDILQEDESLLMYYDNAVTRYGG